MSARSMSMMSSSHEEHHEQQEQEEEEHHDQLFDMRRSEGRQSVDSELLQPVQSSATKALVRGSSQNYWYGLFQPGSCPLL